MVLGLLRDATSALMIEGLTLLVECSNRRNVVSVNLYGFSCRTLRLEEKHAREMVLKK
jgi:hypothetical protein